MFAKRDIQTVISIPRALKLVGIIGGAWATLVLMLPAGCNVGQPTGAPAATATQPPVSVAPTATAQPASTATAAVVPVQTQAASKPTPSSSGSVDEIVASLQGLDIDAFFEASYRQLLLRDPEKITELGLAKQFGVRQDQLADLSDAYLRDTQKLESAILAQLQTYERGELSPAQQLSADVYAWYLQDRVRGHAFMYADYPVSPVLVSYHTELTLLFTDLHPVRDVQEARDYVSRLSQVKRQADQVIDGLKRRQAAGVVLPRFYFPLVLNELRDVAHANPRDTPFSWM